MGNLTQSPRNFRELVLADLLRAQRLIQQMDDEIDPQLRIALSEGDWWIGITLGDDLKTRELKMRKVSRFMQWKMSPAFTLASELKEPEAVGCIGVSHRECHGVLSHIARSPLRFSREQWRTRAQIGDELPAMLPRGTTLLDHHRGIAELKELFAQGKFPAVQLH